VPQNLNSRALTTDAIVILHARGRRLAKLIDTDGSIVGYDEARTFDATEVVVHGLDHLAAILLSLLPCWDRCAVRGSLIHSSPAIGIRRLFHPKPDDPPTFYEVPRRYVAIDFDGDEIERPRGIPATDIAACARIAISHLPSEFHGRACIAVATGSHGIRPGIRLRLWYWLHGGATRKLLQPWFFGVQGVDLATFRPVQPCYTARPVLADGVTDPVPERLVVLPGEPLVPIRPMPLPPPPMPVESVDRGTMAGRVGQAGRLPPVSDSPPPSTGRRSDAYRDAALAGIEAELLRASEGQRHHELIAAATRLFELGSLSDGWVTSFIRDAAVALNGRGSRQIDSEEVDELLDWAKARATLRAAA
jgi:hypothetical protein